MPAGCPFWPLPIQRKGGFGGSVSKRNPTCVFFWFPFEANPFRVYPHKYTLAPPPPQKKKKTRGQPTSGWFGVGPVITMVLTYLPDATATASKYPLLRLYPSCRFDERVLAMNSYEIHFAPPSETLENLIPL